MGLSATGEGIDVKAAQAMRRKAGFRPYTGPTLEGERTVLRAGDKAFPQVFRDIPQPPEALYVVGDASALGDGLAVVGARRATPYGLSCAKRFAGYAARRGITIVSGGALGCDSAAHEAALAQGGRTVAFLGGGVDQIYPARNQPLFQRIVDAGGAVASEHPWDFPPLPHTFRARNRLIAADARAVLIVEAGLPSGTFSTADEALAANRDVLVVPGAITSKTSAGANRLLYQGATPIIDDDAFDDVLCGLFDLLRWEDGGRKAAEGHGPGGLPANDSLLRALIAEPMRMERMVALERGRGEAEGAAAARVNAHVAALVAAGHIARYPDGRYGPAHA